jgi:cell division protein FtsB
MRRSSVVLRWTAVGALALIGVLYYQPLRTYMETRNELVQREGAVRALERERDALEARLAATGTAEMLTREARRLGLVRPGERLFIVKGIDAWRRAHTARHRD